MRLLKPNRRPGGQRPRRCTWDIKRRKGCTARMQNINQNFPSPTAPFRFATLTSTTPWGKEKRPKAITNNPP